jgi:sulfofructose kinase
MNLLAILTILGLYLMTKLLAPLDVLCIGHASYDLVFSVAQQPAADEKTVADSLLGCGGGPAANAAVCIARLGYHAGFCGYLGDDVYGSSHLQELHHQGVDTSLLVRDHSPTPLSVVLVKPDGKRSLINYKGATTALPVTAIDFGGVTAKVLLLDGHEPHISLKLLAQQPLIPTVLDAGSLHQGTQALMNKVDYLLCSEKFARQYAGELNTALTDLAALAPTVIITLGEQGLIWRRGSETGQLTAPTIQAIDSTGAGDAFHGAFAAGLAADMAWPELLRYASAAGAYCCTQMGARPGMPYQEQLQSLLQTWPAQATFQNI